MSLKAFHVVFVAFSTILCIGFGVWAIQQSQTANDVSLTICGVLSFVGAVSLLVYGRWFLRKLKNVSYL